MKAWWDSLSRRERHLIGSGMALTLALLIYALAWQPFRASYHRLQQSVAEQRADLAWMRQVAQEVQRLSGAGENAHATADGRSLLTRVDQTARAAGFGPGVTGDGLDSAASPRGFRLLSKVPRLPPTIIDRLVDHFDSLQRLLAANLEDLMDVDGVGEGRARAVREGLSRLAESSILERYV